MEVVTPALEEARAVEGTGIGVAEGVGTSVSLESATTEHGEGGERDRNSRQCTQPVFP